MHSTRMMRLRIHSRNLTTTRCAECTGRELHLHSGDSATSRHQERSGIMRMRLHSGNLATIQSRKHVRAVGAYVPQPGRTCVCRDCNGNWVSGPENNSPVTWKTNSIKSLNGLMQSEELVSCPTEIGRLRIPGYEPKSNACWHSPKRPAKAVYLYVTFGYRVSLWYLPSRNRFMGPE